MPEGPARGGGAPDQRVRDRQVLYIALAVVVFVIGLQLVSALVPAVGQVLGFAPVLIGALIVVTIFVLARALRPR
ncbi:MAG TPA: hypothetical protein VMP67_08290 [Candidatus Limnocylindria bacterium]|nr:hypothetical protein [Candidatus Limnocylindria bacterium]